MPILSVDDIVVSEADALATLTLRLDSPATQVGTVTWTTVGASASGNNDYAHLSNQLVTFQVGQQTRTIQIPITDDSSLEKIEAFYVEFSSTDLTLEREFATIQIADNDDNSRAPVASVADIVVDEGAGTAQAVILLDRVSSVPVTVSYRTVAETAEAGSDFTARTSSVTFAAGETAKTIDLAILNDAAAEADETFRFELTAISGVTGAKIGDGAAQVTIAANDGPTAATPTVRVDDMVYTEGAAEGYMEVTFRLSAPAASATSIDWYTSNGSASGNNDYDHFYTNTLTFAAGETVKTVRIPIYDDANVEGTEQFYINLSSPVGLLIDQSFATMTIVDNDATNRAPIASVADLVVDESDNAAHFAITLDRASTVPVTVSYRTVADTAAAGSDFAARSGSVTFNPGETAKIVDVAILDDTAAEGAESFRLELTAISGVTGATIGDGLADAVIGLSDGPTAATPTVHVDDMVYAEGATDGYMAITFRLSAPSASATSVNWYTSNGSASGNNDYAHFYANTLTFAAGETVKTVRIPIYDDANVEGTEQFYINLASPVGLNIVKPFATMSIVDNDLSNRAPFASVADTAVNESDGFAHFAITLDRASSVPVTLSYETTDATAKAGSDFVARKGSVTFNPGETAKVIDVAILDDTAGEAAETFGLKLTKIAGVTNAAVADATATATIGRSDGTAAATPQLTVKAIEGTEGGANLVSFLFELNARSASATSVDWSTASGSAQGNNDYAHFYANTLTFAPGETVKLVQIPVYDDTTVESTENFVLNLSSPVGLSLAATSVTNTIRDNDAASVSVAAVTPEVAEGSTGGTKAIKFILARDGATTAAQAVTWKVATVAGGATAADFAGGTLPSGTVSFAAGQTTKTVTVTINSDTAIETNEAFKLVLSAPTNGLKLADAETTTTILNDDKAAATATYAIAALAADKAEGDSGTTAFTFTVSRAGDLTGAGSVAWAVTGNGTDAANAADFGAALPSGTVSFTAGQASKTVTVQVAGDTVAEKDEGFKVTLSGPVNGTIATASATGVIRDDDSGSGQTYNGTEAGNTYAGGPGDDTINGNGGADKLSGGAGKDTIDGGTGGDRITGGAGADLLTGGAGPDVFVFTALADSTPALAGRDQILDFSHADKDKINLKAIDADATKASDQAFHLVADDFTGAPGEISISSWGRKHLVQADVDGDGVADFAVTVFSDTVLVGSDFVF